MTSTMKAMVIEGFGGSEVLVRRDLPVPNPGPGEVLIEVKASSVNPVDWKMRSGLAAFLVPVFPAVLHADCAGVIVARGEGVQDFDLGDEVWSFATGLMGKQGALAEYMVADARMIAHKPVSMSFEEAATIPLVAVTSWLCLIERCRIDPWSSILIQGGTGGVGFFALQLARARFGETVYATCGSDDKCRIAEDLGAKKAFDYTRVATADMVKEATAGRGFDVVFNTPGQATINAAVEAAAFEGTILDINGAFPDGGNFQANQLGFLSVFAGYPMTHGFHQEKVSRILTEVAALVDAGKIHPLVDERRFTFAEVGEAHDYQEKGRPTGKVALSAHW